VTSVLEFDSIARAYVRDFPVLTGVSFSLAEGEVVGLLGRNGSGKTTLIHIAMGMLLPQGGSVRVFGLSPFDNAVQVKKRIGYVADEQVLPTSATIAELIAFYRWLFPRWDDQLERHILDRFSLDITRRIMHLSKGQNRAVALLLAICHTPELLILDEPAAGLDPAARREFLKMSIHYLNHAGATILFSSHYMNDVERLGSRVVMLDGGKVCLDSDLDRLREEYCVALVPMQSVPDSESLTRIPGCLRARSYYADWRAIFEGTPKAVENLLEQSLGSKRVRCERVTLEELFVELMGSNQWEERL
jgi:ABC-2 type transport system ATP-binding protein